MIENIETAFQSVRDQVIERLRSELPPALYYHSPEHTIDVLRQAEFLGNIESLSQIETYLLRLAALFHDTGFTLSAEDHEEYSCRFAAPYLAQLQLSEEERAEVEKAIMATRIPQSPQSRIGEILCDADLDYLGRDDFFPIGHQLFLELQANGKLSSLEQWNKIQISFLKQHRYFTQFCRQHREPVKLGYLYMLESGSQPKPNN